MAILRSEIISRVQSMYNRGVASDDSRLSARQIYSKIKTTRALLLKRELERKRSTHSMSEWNIQTLGCVKMELVPPHECPCAPPVGCKILKSKCKLPKPIQSNIMGPYLTDVTTLDGSTVFTATTWSRKKYRNADKYTANNPDYFMRNEHLYITVNTDLEFVSVSGVFEDPDDAEAFSAECSCEVTVPGFSIDCTPHYSKELILDEYLVEPLIQMVMKEILLITNYPQDTTNDAKDDTKSANNA